MAGESGEDIFTAAYVDLDPGPGTQAWNCIPQMTYDGHRGTDTLIRSFGEQEIGVPIFAALDGTVIFVHDGEPDMNTAWLPGAVANQVWIDHGFGREARYLHFKKSSINVVPGQTVKAGQQIGLTGSSGRSEWPHLHFQALDNGAVFDPYAGPCRAGMSAWVEQPPFSTDLRFFEFSITADDPDLLPQPPFALPASGTFVQGQQNIWVHGSAWPVGPGSSYSLRLLRPNGTLGASLTGTWSAPVGPFTLPLPGANFSANLNVTGSWTLEFDNNGQQVVQLPFEVVASAGQIINRAPYPVTAEITPTVPSTDDVLICHVQNFQNNMLLDDPDFDIVEYHYVWTVESTVVRNVTTAARTDVLQRHLALTGDRVVCEVTPSDGAQSAATVQASVDVLAIGTSYCRPATPNSSGLPGITRATGSPSAAANDVTLTASQLPPNQFGIFVTSMTQGFSPGAGGNSNGNVCLAGSIGRYTAGGQVLSTGGNGEFSLVLDLAATPQGSGFATVTAGQTCNFQAWHRDGVGLGSNFTDGYSVLFR